MAAFTFVIDFILHIDRHLQALCAGYGLWVYAILFVIVFCETGLVVTPLLPGDSLLFAIGVFCGLGSLDIYLTLGLLSVAAVLGDTVNYAVGNYIGMVIENKLALGTLVIRAIVNTDIEPLAKSLKDAGYGFTYFDAQGSTGPVKIIYSVINRKELNDVVQQFHVSHPHIFFTVEEARLASEGVFHPQPLLRFKHLGLKGKR